MTASHSLRSLTRKPLWRALAAGVLLAAAGAGALAPTQALAQVQAQAQAQADPPTRVARLNYSEGPVSQAGTDTGNDWSAAEINRPLTSGDRIWAGQGARAELHFGAAALRLDAQTSVDFMRLDDQTAQLRLSQGRMDLRVRQLWPGERLEVGTANLAFVINQPGDYRIEVDPSRNVTRVAVGAGAGTLYGEGGETTQLGAAQQLAFTNRNLTPVAGQSVAQNDAFDRWAAERDRIEDQSVSARYVSRETPGYQQLDQYGDWQTDTTYGPVWYPRVTVSDWAPYRYGQWRWISPWGWTWVDDAPWGFAPFHYGRWAQVGARWAWVPGPVVRRPVYAPALVGFSGGSGVQWHPHAPGRPNAGWFPLGPGEHWRPGYRASQRYVDNVNRQAILNIGLGRPPGTYVYQNTPGAMTIANGNPFEHRRPVRVHDRAPLQAFVPNLPPNASPRERAEFDRAHPGLPGREHRQMEPQQLPTTRQQQVLQATQGDQAMREQAQREQVQRQQQQQMEQRQREQGQRQQQVQAAQQEQFQREQAQREQAQRQQQQRMEQAQREQAQRQQQVLQATQNEQFQRDQMQREQMQREQAQRQQQQQMEQAQREQAMRQQQNQAAQREQAQRDQIQREQAQRLQQQQMEQAQRQQQAEQAQRQQQVLQATQQREQMQREQAHREQAQREQAQRQQQQQMEQAQRQQREQQERAQRQQQQAQQSPQQNRAREVMRATQGQREQP